jgi:hypothetical protein
MGDGVGRFNQSGRRPPRPSRRTSLLPLILIVAMWPLAFVWKRTPSWGIVAFAGVLAAFFLTLAIMNPEMRYIHLSFAFLAVIFARRRPVLTR